MPKKELRKRRGSGDSPGLQNRRTASPMSLVRSTRTRFRHLFCAFASHLTSLPSSWLLPRLNVSCIIPQKPSLQPLHPQEPSSHMRSWLSRGSHAENGLNRLVWYAKPTQVGSQPAPKVVPSVPRDSGNLPCWTDHEPFEVRQGRRSASWRLENEAAYGISRCSPGRAR